MYRRLRQEINLSTGVLYRGCGVALRSHVADSASELQLYARLFVQFEEQVERELFNNTLIAADLHTLEDNV